MIRLLIADDHTVVRRGLKQIVGQEADMTVVGEASSSQELLALARQQPADAILLDITLPGRSGLEALKDLGRERPEVPVLVLSMHPEDQYAVRTLKAGAAGYLTKESAPEELVKAIRRIVRGGRYVSESLAERLAKGLTTDPGRLRHESLSDREYQVMCLLASGKSVGEIASELALSVRTINTYRTRVLEKMSMRHGAELTHYAIKNKLV